MVHVCSILWSCPALCNLMDCSPPGFSIHGIYQTRILEWVAISYSRESPQPRDWTWIFFLLHWQADSLPLYHLGSPFIGSVQLLSHVQLFVNPCTAACQASLFITNSQSMLKLPSIESVIPSNHLILCGPLLLPSIFPSIRVFSDESVLCIKWPKYWSFSFSIGPSNEYSGLISFRIDWFGLLSVQGPLKSPIIGYRYSKC